MTSYRLVFRKKATREWNKLGANPRSQFERKLAERLRFPRVVKDQLSGYRDCFKIKLRRAGYRLIYQVDDDRVIVIVVKIGQREGGKVYKDFDRRLAEEE